MKPTRGIFLVANRFSSDHCHNLIYSIRETGCRLPIRIIPWGGEPMRLTQRFDDVELVSVRDFSPEAQSFVADVKRRMPKCVRPGNLNRYLAWFGEFEEFLYSDNDIVALMNWEEMFEYLTEHELVNADYEYTTKGRFNMIQPARFEQAFGPGALERAVTAGHFVCRPSPQHLTDIESALSWMEQNSEVAKWHDQALLHVALTIGNWRCLNLCKPPHNWASSWAGDYKNSFEIIRTVQARRQPMSHVHYSGGNPSGARPIDELLYASLPMKDRNQSLLQALLREASGLAYAQHLLVRARRKLKRMRASKG